MVEQLARGNAIIPGDETCSKMRVEDAGTHAREQVVTVSVYAATARQ